MIIKVLEIITGTTEITEIVMVQTEDQETLLEIMIPDHLINSEVTNHIRRIMVTGIMEIGRAHV